MAKQPPHRIDMNLPILPDIELAATGGAEGIGQLIGLGSEQIDEVKMALIEACINVIEHSKSSDGQIDIDFNLGEDALTIVIADKGRGFDKEAVLREIQQRHDQGEGRGWACA
ncbi:MAG: ATP-binding protein [Candidatus Latescibacteria bacterium]|nr:ATP-binding protein [Candidatus Latescibacterota bacterium]